MGRRDGAREDGLRKLFVGGLSQDTTDDTFKDYFSAFGNIADSVVIKDDQGRSKGFGFVTFTEDHETDACIKAKEEGHNIDGKSVEVKRAIPRDAEPEQREKNTKMFIGGLNWSTSEDTIKQYFEETFNCQVESVDLIYEKKDQVEPGQQPKPRGFGFVTINDFDVVDKCCILKTHNIDGKAVEVKKAAPKGGRDGGDGGRSGGRGGRGGGRGGGRDYNQGGGRDYNQGGGRDYNQGGDRYNSGGDRYNSGSDRYNSGSDRYNSGSDRYNSGSDRYNSGGDRYNSGGGYNSEGGYSSGGGYNQGGGYGQQQQQQSYGGGYQNSSFSGPDKGGRGSRQGSTRGGYRPY